MSRLYSRRWIIAGIVPACALLVSACQATAPPAEKKDSAAPKPVTKLFLMVDLVTGSKNQTDSKLSCVLNSRFPRNAQMVWRARVFDPLTGDLMDDKTLTKVEVRLDNGTNIDMKFGPHPAKTQPQETFWTTSWMIPKTHPTGTLSYSVVATSTDGRTGEFKPFITQVSLPTILDEVLADAPTPVPKPAEEPAKPKP
jgi:hypothetical protein